MKICALFCLLAFFLHIPTAKAFDFADFYSVFAQTDDKVILMPDRLRLNLTPGQSGDIRLITRPENIPVDWECSSEEICRITQSSDGGCTLTALQNGDVTVTVKDKRSRASADVRVHISSSPLKLRLDTKALTLSPGESAIVRASIEGGDGSPVITWSAGECVRLSYGENLCRIKAMQPGHTQLTATAENASATADITVRTVQGNWSKALVYILIVAAILLISYAFVSFRRN